MTITTRAHCADLFIQLQSVQDQLAARHSFTTISATGIPVATC